jgi:hypothetical protein
MEKGGLVIGRCSSSILGLAYTIERSSALRRAKINVNEFLAKIRKALMVNRSIMTRSRSASSTGARCPDHQAGLLKYGQPKEDAEKTIERRPYEMGRPSALAVLPPPPTSRRCSASWAPSPA